MVVQFAPVAVEAAVDPCERATWVALCAIGELTRLANDAHDVDAAWRLHRLANDIEAAALGAVGVAIDKAETLTRQA